MTPVARVATLDRLRALVDGAEEHGSAPVDVLLLGEAGSGKTHLLGHLSATWPDQSSLRRARGVELAADLPLAVLAELLGSTDDGGAATPARPVGEALGLPPDVGPRELAAAVAPRLAGALVLLDDAHWADPASLLVLRHVCRRPPSGLRVVLAARSLEALPREAVDESTVLVQLTPLLREEARQLAPEVRTERLEELRRAAGGNTLLLTELLHAEQAGGRSSVAGVAPLVLRRVAALGDDAREVLEAAAAAGDPCASGDVLAVCGVPEPRAHDALDALRAAALLEPRPEAGRLAFRHPVVRAVVHDATPAGRRAGLHRAIADELRARGAAPEAIAPHVLEVGQVGDASAVVLLLTAARRVSASTPRTAVRWLRRALDLAQGEAGHLAAPAGLALATAHLEGGDPEACLSLIGHLRAGGVRVAHARLLALESTARRALGTVDGLRARLERSLTVDLEPAERALIAGELAALSLEDGQFGAVVRHASAAAGARRGEDPAATAAYLALAAVGFCCREERGAGQRLLEECEGLLEPGTGDPTMRVRARTAMADALLYGVGRPAEAGRMFDRAEREARAGGTRLALPAVVRGSLAHTLAGRIEPALAAAERASDLAREIGSPYADAQAAVARCWAELGAGRVERALAVERRWADEIAGSPILGVRVAWGWMSAQALLAGGRSEEAIARIGRALGPQLELGEPLGRAFAREVLVCAHLRLGQLDRARATCAAAQPAVGLPLAAAVDDLTAAHVALADGETAAAEALADAAFGLAAGADAALPAARAGLVAAAARAQGGDRDGARRRRRDVEAYAWAAGLRLDTWPADLPSLTPRVAEGIAPAVTGPALQALSPRQREVAFLLAEGRTNAEIAGALGLSVYTVGDHVRAVLSRLGVQRRSAVARAIGLGSADARPAA